MGIAPQLVLCSAVLGALLACGGKKAEPAPTRIRWTFQALPISYASPALSLDGETVYFGTAWWESAAPTTGQALHALATATGAVRWSYALGSSEVRSAPAVASDGSITFVVETRGTPTAVALHRVSGAGTQLWTYDVNPSDLEAYVGILAPAIGADGAVFVAGDQLYAVEPGGTLRWKALTPSFELLRSSPVIGADGTVYFAAHNVPLTAFDPADGAVLWSLPLGWNDYVFGSPAIGADGTIYVASNDGALRAVSSAGALKWTWWITDAGYAGSFKASPAVGPDGTIYVGITQGSPANAFFALTAAGALRWVFDPTDLPADLPHDNAEFESSPALGDGGVVYVANEFGNLYALDTADGTVLWVQATSQGIGWPSPALGADGTIFIGDIGGGCYAIDTGGTGPDLTAPWPKYRGDAQNTGRRP